MGGFYLYFFCKLQILFVNLQKENTLHLYGSKFCQFKKYLYICNALQS